MFERIASLQVKGCGLPFSDRSVIDQMVLAASRMMLKGDSRQNIKSDCMDGIMVSSHQFGNIGGISGCIYTLTANFQGLDGDVSMDFILVRPMSEEEVKMALWIIAPENFDGLGCPLTVH